jgi:hypothetical protein
MAAYARILLLLDNNGSDGTNGNRRFHSEESPGLVSLLLEDVFVFWLVSFFFRDVFVFRLFSLSFFFFRDVFVNLDVTHGL